MLQAALLHAAPVCGRLQQLDCRGLSGALMLHALALQLYCPHHKLLLHHTLHLHSHTTQATGHEPSCRFALCHGCSVLS